MTIAEQTLTQARLLAGELSNRETQLLELFCSTALTGLIQRLKAELTLEDCVEELVPAAAMLALAALSEADPTDQFSAGEISMRMASGSKSAAADCLRIQAQILMAPYFQVPVPLMGV